MFISIMSIRTAKYQKENKESNIHSSHQDNMLNKIQTTHQTQSQPFTDKTKQQNNPQLHNGIILSDFNQSSPIFISPGQGLQCVANCVMSIIYHKYKNCISWKLIDIKNILYSGNVLYNSVGKFTTILVSDLPKHIKLYNTIYNIQEVNSTIGNIFVDNKNFNSLSFVNVEKIILKYKYVILVLGCSALSIIHSENNFYTFDPHKRNTCGLPDSSGGAVVLKFNSFEKLCLYIYELSNNLNTTDYELTPIIVKKYNHIKHDNPKEQNSNVEQEIHMKNNKNINVANDRQNQTEVQIENSLTNKCETIKNTTTQINQVELKNITTKDKIIHNNNSINKTSQQMRTQNNVLESETLLINEQTTDKRTISKPLNNLETNSNKNSTKLNSIDVKTHKKLNNNIPEESHNKKYNTFNLDLTKYNNNINPITTTNIDETITNIHKRKITTNENLQSRDEIIKKRKLMNTDTLKNKNINTNKRKINNDENNVHLNKRTKHENKYNNYQYIEKQKSCEKLIPISHMIVLKKKKETKKHTRKFFKTRNYVPNMDINLRTRVLFI